MPGPILQGHDFNFYQKLTISSATFASEANTVFNFRGQQNFSLMNQGTGVIEYSFNGNTLHGDLTPSTGSVALTFYNRRVSRIWFRLASGSPTIVRIEAWAR